MSRGFSVRGGLCQGGSLSRGSLSEDPLSRGVCGDEGSLSEGVSVHGSLCPARVSVKGISDRWTSVHGASV